MNIKDAQNDMKLAYFGGGPGMLSSGLVWICAGFAGLFFSVQTSVFTLFIGGMFIHPLGIAISKLLKRSGKHSTNNLLGTLALETTFLLFIGLFIAFTVVQIKVELFFPTMLLIIGGRYLSFNSLYGNRLYWFFGGFLVLAGVLCIIFDAPFVTGAFFGGGIEIIGGIVIMLLLQSEAKADG
ncbi:MAG: hypothetical protein AAF614_02105 [Chloroflexota bacterium]